MLVLLVANGLAMLASILRVLLTVRQYDFKITVRFTQYGIDSFQRGDWYNLYELALFAGVAGLLAIALALRLHENNRNLAIAVLWMQLIVFFFLFFVTGALLNTPSVTS